MKDCIEYSQPDFYKFSEDSILLSKYAAVFLESHFGSRSYLTGLDLCAGSGVIGIETIWQAERLQDKIERFDFCELQLAFEAHLKKNIESLKQFVHNKINFNIWIKDFRSESFISDLHKYDFILSNPPYFLKGAGRKPIDEKRAKCRFWSDLDRMKFYNFIDQMLSPSGVAIIVLKENWLGKYFELSLKRNTKKIKVINQGQLSLLLIY